MYNLMLIESKILCIVIEVLNVYSALVTHHVLLEDWSAICFFGH